LWVSHSYSIVKSIFSFSWNALMLLMFGIVTFGYKLIFKWLTNGFVTKISSLSSISTIWKQKDSHRYGQEFLYTDTGSTNTLLIAWLLSTRLRPLGWWTALGWCWHSLQVPYLSNSLMVRWIEFLVMPILLYFEIPLIFWNVENGLVYMDVCDGEINPHIHRVV
jgi:hypothetical protein